MKTSKAVLIVLGLLLSGAISNQISAQTYNKRTKLTFSHPVAIPGQVLPAGSYTFTVVDSAGTRNIVQIWNEDKTNLIATVMTIFNYRLKPTDETVIEFKEQPANTPQAIKVWFAPGYDYGAQFVYPKQQAVQIAEASNEVVPAETVEPTPETLKTVPLVAVTPKGEEEPIAKEFPAKPAEEPKTVAKELPKTASPLPLIALIGVSCLALGFTLRRFAARTL